MLGLLINLVVLFGCGFFIADWEAKKTVHQYYSVPLDRVVLLMLVGSILFLYKGWWVTPIVILIFFAINFWLVSRKKSSQDSK